MQQRTWRFLCLVSLTTTIVAWALIAFGVGIELLPEPDAPPRAKPDDSILWEALVLMSAWVAPICALFSGYRGWLQSRTSA